MSTCIEFQGYRLPDGYGRKSVRGRLHRAHRLAWEQASGRPVPPGLSVLHRCDNPACINPDHLFLGTQADNMRDAAAKGRLSTPARIEANRQRATGRTGELNGNHRLTEEDVAAIHARYATGVETLRGLGSEFGVHNATIARIVHGQRWVAALDELP